MTASTHVNFRKFLTTDTHKILETLTWACSARPVSGPFASAAHPSSLWSASTSTYRAGSWTSLPLSALGMLFLLNILTILVRYFLISFETLRAASTLIYCIKCNLTNKMWCIMQCKISQNFYSYRNDAQFSRRQNNQDRRGRTDLSDVLLLWPTDLPGYTDLPG